MQTVQQSPYQHLLVAMDFSKSSYAALQRAICMAQQYQAQITVLHVIELPINPILEDNAVSGIPGVWDQQTTEVLLQAAKHKMQSLKEEISALKPVDSVLNTEIKIGHPAREICTFTELNQVDCILIGFHGHSAWRAFIGSTSHSVLQEAKCDVLNVKIDNKD
ncbi:universal stress protein [Thiomicrorhabdus sp. 6S2-11]|uniref:Universal stress protein n=1 Tax=Thiomicrorhabdus marina TaxID=2818442 RepID=A0ABS3Q2Q9_9GAMM|nr:universal stress protein [Thiomicrorhabdus marina]MBO1926624.1 universal stress protein [Thiomicrorhabdus marina]